MNNIMPYMFSFLKFNKNILLVSKNWYELYSEAIILYPIKIVICKDKPRFVKNGIYSLTIKNCSGDMQSISAKKLKFISCDIYDLSKFIYTKKLSLKKCKYISEIPYSIEAIKLEALYIDNCISLRKIYNFTYLKKISVKNCCRNLQIPYPNTLEKIYIDKYYGSDPGKLNNLKKLRIENCDSRKLYITNNINYSKIEKLSINDCDIDIDISSFTNLKKLDIRYIGNQIKLINSAKLEKLIIICCEIKETCELNNLKKFVVTGCESISNLFSNFTNFDNLTKLYILECSNLKVIPNFTNLKLLHIFKSDNITEIPVMYKLETLRIKHSEKISKLPELPSLRFLNLETIKHRIMLPAYNLEKLDIFDCDIKLPEFKYLKRLDVNYNNDISLPNGISDTLEKLMIETNYEIKLVDFKCLKELNIVGSLKYLYLPGTIANTLVKLSIHGCENIYLPEFKCLEYLELTGCISGSLPDSIYSTLKTFKISRSLDNMDYIPNFKCLKVLKITYHYNCNLFERSIHYDMVNTLEKLEIINYKGVIVLPKFKCLKILGLFNCPNIEKIHKIITLRKLDILGCKITKIPNICLQKLSLTDCENINYLPNNLLSSLNELNIENCSIKLDSKLLGKCANLKIYNDDVLEN